MSSQPAYASTQTRYGSLMSHTTDTGLLVSSSIAFANFNREVLQLQYTVHGTVRYSWRRFKAQPPGLAAAEEITFRQFGRKADCLWNMQHWRMCMLQEGLGWPRVRGQVEEC